MKSVAIALLAIVFTFYMNPLAAKNDKGNQGRKDLPPGLQKKVARGGQLPPGWQKRVQVGEPLEPEIYQHREIVVPVDKKGLLTVRIDGKLIRLYEATREVVEILEQ